MATAQTYAPAPQAKHVFAGRAVGVAAGIYMAHDLLGFVVCIFAGFVLDIFLAQYVLPRRRQMLLRQQISVNMIELCAKMCKAKGNVTRHDVETLRQSLAVSEEDLPLVSDLFNRARTGTQGFDRLASRLAVALREAPGELEMILRVLYDLALADRLVDSNERVFLLRVAEIFGITPIRLRRIEQELGLGTTAEDATFEQAFNQGHKQDHTGFTRTPKDGMDDAYAALGVKRGAAEADVKRAYRKMVMQHHPDRLRGNGASTTDIKRAEERMAKINDAYNRILGKI